MAKKKATTSAAKPKAAKRKATKRPAVKSATAETAVKTRTPKAGARAATRGTQAAAASKPKAAAKAKAKKAPAVKLTTKQQQLMSSIASSGDGGFTDYSKTEARSLEALKTKKLLKTGAKDKATGKAPYHVTKTGQKALEAAEAPGS